MDIVIEQIAVLFIFAFVGYLLAKTGIVKAEHSKVLSTLIVYVFCPSVVINSFSTNFTVKYLSEKYMMLIISIVILAVIGLAAYFISELFSKDRYERGIYAYSLIVPNYGYMGYALAEGIFGEKMLLDVIIIGIPLTVFIYAIGFPMLTDVKKINLKGIINPALIAIAIGCVLGLTQIPLPAAVTTVLTKAGNCMAPTAMLLMGIAISEFKISGLFKNYKIYMVTILRLIAIPFIVAAALAPICSKELIIAVLLIYILPCGLNTVVFPKLVGKNCEIGASLALISGVFSLITIPVWLYFYI